MGNDHSLNNFYGDVAHSQGTFNKVVNNHGSWDQSIQAQRIAFHPSLLGKLPASAQGYLTNEFQSAAVATTRQLQEQDNAEASAGDLIGKLGRGIELILAAM